MGRDSITETIKSSWEIILQQITSPAKEKVNRRTSYICPLCGHGTHGDGLTLNPKSSGGYGLKCFGSCGFSGDIIDLIGEVEHIDSYPEKLKRAGELAGVDVNTGNIREDFKPAPRSEQSYSGNEQMTGTYTPTHTQVKTGENNLQYYRECQTRLKDTDYLARRGISQELANRFMLGYEPDFKTKDHDTDQFTTWGALIIPTGYTSYNARNTDPEASKRNRYRNRGDKTPFNLKALEDAQKPIYIVEGEIDALSIIEVGGEAIGLSGSDNIDKIIMRLKEKKPAQPLVIALDNDEKGQEKTKELEGKLEALGVKYYTYNPAGEYKDSNEAMLKSPEAFRKAVAEAENLEAEAFEEEKAEYMKNATSNHLQAFINDIAEKANTRAQSTGFFHLDNALDGGFYPGLYVLGAISSLGKTTLALEIMDNIAQQGRDVLIFSLEMSRYELMAKSISRHTFTEAEETGRDVRLAKGTRGITTGDRYKRYSLEEKKLIQDAVTVYGEYAEHIYISEGLGDIGASLIRETLEKHIRFTDNELPPVVLIDYLQLLAPQNERMTDKQAVDKNVMELKRISRDFNTTVIAISSVNRSNYMTPIDFESFKESGAIEFSADVVLGLQLACLDEELFAKEGKISEKRARIKEAKAENPRQIQLLVLKNRNGETSTKVDFDYYQVFNAFIEH